MSVLRSTAIFLTSEPLIGKQQPFSCKHSFEHKALSLGLSVFARACEQFAVHETLGDWHSANSRDRSNKSGDFQDQGEEHSSGYRGGVKIDLGLSSCFMASYIPSCRCGIGFEVFSHSSFASVCTRWKIPCVASIGRPSGVTAEFWWFLTKNSPKFLSKASIFLVDQRWLWTSC